MCACISRTSNSQPLDTEISTPHTPELSNEPQESFSFIHEEKDVSKRSL